MFIVPDLFTPYLQGVEAGRQANWDDLNQYNKVQAGQLTNMFNLATFSPRANALYNADQQQRLSNQFSQDTYNNQVAMDNYATLMGYGNAARSMGALPPDLARSGQLGNLYNSTDVVGTAYRDAQTDAAMRREQTAAQWDMYQQLLAQRMAGAMPTAATPSTAPGTMPISALAADPMQIPNTTVTNAASTVNYSVPDMATPYPARRP